MPADRTITVDVKGEAVHQLSLAEVLGDERERAPSYADLLQAVGLSPHEVSVLVDGRPVPEDRPVDADHVTVLRLIKGG